MKKSLVATFSVLALTGIFLSSTAQAEFSGAFEVDATVIDSSERYVIVRELKPYRECREVQVSSGGSTSSDTPELIGALVGGAIGKEINENSKSSTVIGAILGASIASDIEKNQAAGKGGTRMETRCTTVEREVESRRLDGYDVSYEYGGHLFRATTPDRPGSTIRVKVYALPVNYTN